MKKAILFSICTFLCIFAGAQTNDIQFHLSESLSIQTEHLFALSLQEPASVASEHSLSYTLDQEGKEYRRNAVYFELFGPGIFYSLNYERRISPHFNLRAGFTSWSLGHSVLTLFLIEELKFTAFPLMVNYITGPTKSHHLEIGAGVMPSFFSGKAFFSEEDAQHQSLLLGIGSFGYRYQPADGGFFFRGAYTPLFSQEGFSSFIGLSFGIGF